MPRTSPPSIALASLAAGPIFLASTAAASLYLRLPRPVVVEPWQAASFVLMAMPAVIVGFLLSVLPNMIGSRLMVRAGAALPWARAPVAWAASGALMGGGLVGLTGAFSEPAAAFGLIATSACCAAICRLSVCWD
ncbi:MAG TPA: hypothetical protein VF759_00035 [Allosphingosinicella sp.]